MKSPVLFHAVVAAIFLTVAAAPASAASIAEAAAAITLANKLIEKLTEVPVPAPEPIAGNTGKFVVPYTTAGTPAPWAEKAVAAKTGSMAGGVAADKAMDKVTGKIPLAGLMRGKAKEKASAEAAAVAAGGWDYIRETSDLSFDHVDDLAVYLHVTHAASGELAGPLSAAMDVYPSLQKRYNGAIKNAQRDAKKAAKKAAKANK